MSFETDPNRITTFNETYKKVQELMVKFDIHTEELTAKQLAAVITQALSCGDFQRHIIGNSTPSDHRQMITYIPFAREAELLTRIEELEQQLKEKTMTTIVPHELPEYRCIKTVRAAKITAIKPDGAEGAWLEFSDDRRVWVDREFMMKHDPKAGGWFVVYKDGYCSWSPGNAFEEGYVSSQQKGRFKSAEEESKTTLEEAEANLSNAVYEAAIYLERLEDAGKVSGNGHHAAQLIARFAESELRRRWKTTDPDSGNACEEGYVPADVSDRPQE